MAHGEKPPASFEDFDKRLHQARGGVAEPETAAEIADTSGYGPGLQAGIDIIAGFVGGGLIGYGLDYLFGTSPVFLILLILLGAAGGMRNAVRTLARYGASGSETGSKRG
ncbi:AtpZ/AtpI family protein [Marinivivus vitaminiproducens]|uniref:AtpZ/AtpI family protein n=1 Tax=Marinivivus vitaminiproducens TaxID=3035935 RepID=UPI00279C84EE|nr:AtpZ/AtpI family protein [Geminicoccaceae bacterium SCSIO 64248]